MERSPRTIAGAIIVLAGSILFGLACIAISAASWGRLVSSDGETAGWWGVATGVVLVLNGLILVFRTGGPDPLRRAIEEKFES